jgi:UDP:flavonoid glycosyltransferase YjiC (YdhE family)
MRVSRKSIRILTNHCDISADQHTPSAGVPQVVLPLWADLYNYAQLAEQTGVGVWACRATSPEWTPECIRDDILKVALNETLRTKAREISAEAGKNGPGRDISAGIIAQLARSGH